jgi:hypothetical protein
MTPGTFPEFSTFGLSERYDRNVAVAVLEMPAKSRTFGYISDEIGVCYDVIRRELTERCRSTAPVKPERRAKRGKGFWRSFDPP